MTEKELQKFKDLLIEERDDILEALKSDNEALNELVGTEEGDLADQAYKHYEKNLVLGITKSEQETLRKIDDALRRIEEGNYGLCEVCGESIETDRLEVIPYTTLCIKHAKERAKRKYR